MKKNLQKNKLNYYNDIPLYPNLINYGLKSFLKISKKIDRIPKINQEWLKVKLLYNELNYLCFIDSLTNIGQTKIKKYMGDFIKDKKFKNLFRSKLKNINKNTKERPDDLRFHAISLYLIVRSLKPKIVIETGVALGKSSSLILLALNHNKYGKLISVDLPNKYGKKMQDGSKTYIGKKNIGWLIPDYLKNRWSLFLGDSKILLPKILSNSKNIPNIFIHDSLHTEEHTNFELALALKSMSSGLIMCDNIEMDSGLAFNKIITKKNSIAYAYRNFAGFIV